MSVYYYAFMKQHSVTYYDRAFIKQHFGNIIIIIMH